MKAVEMHLGLWSSAILPERLHYTGYQVLGWVVRKETRVIGSKPRVEH